MADKFSTDKYFKILDKYFRLANYLSAGQIYLLDNPLLRDHKLCEKDLKRRLVGHFGTVPGQNFVYAHASRVINKFDLDMILISGPGHGGNFLTSNAYIEGTYTEVYPEISQDKKGLKKFFKQFSFPGGIGSHCVPETPGSIHEGGELGYSLAHAFGAVMDNKDLIATVIVGDGEAETGPLATSWLSNKFINPKRDGTVLPILHLNGFKISNPTIYSRLGNSNLKKLFSAYGYDPIFVEYNDKISNIEFHRQMANAMDSCILKIKEIKKAEKTENVVWPMIVLRTPKGWTCPKIVNNKQVEGSFRAHQVPVNLGDENSVEIIKNWLESYKPNELFDENGKIFDEIKSICPKGEKRLSASPYANGGLLLKELNLPDTSDYAVKFKGHGTVKSQDMLNLGAYIRDIFKLNKDNFRIFSPDEALSNRLSKVFESENRAFMAPISKSDEFLSNSGRVFDSYLSEHMCEGWLEGYILTGRHGLFDSYEAFIRVVDSMVAQHAKWLSVCNNIPWRAPISSLNLILTSNVWQQDHNGFTHQDPGFLDHLASKKASVVRIYLPADTNCLLSCYEHCAKSKNYVNAIVASKHPTYQWLSIDEAKKHCAYGVSEWKWAGLNNTKEPDVVIASCGDTATVESLAAVKLIKKYLPKLNVKFVNVVDLMKLVSNKSHPHGLTDAEFDKLFTKDKPVIFNFHGYPSLIHTLTYNRHNQNLHVSGYMEEGTITTSFDMRVLNKTDRFNQLLKVIKYVNIPSRTKKKIEEEMNKKLENHKKYIREFGIDMPEILNWNWND